MNTYLRIFAAFCFTNLSSVTSVAQEVPQVEQSQQHKWLEKFVGHWETTSKSVATEGQPAATMNGEIKSEMVGKFWLVTKMSADLGEFKMDGRQTVGYDKTKRKYVGTWIDNTSDFIWHYQGSVDKTGKILSLEAEGPDMSEPGKSALYRDMYEFVSTDEIKLTSSIKGPDGKWIDFMTGTAKRKR